LLILKEPQLVGLRKGRILEPRQPRDPFDVMKLFDPGLEHAVEGDEA
jgi:hypothetical protein